MGKPRYTIFLENNPRPQDTKTVWDGLAAFNLQHAPADDYQPLALFVRDNQGQIMGGLLGETFWEWLHVSIVWLSEDLRGRGFGRDLLTAAEKEALRRGCHSAFLDTLSFQAVEFYEKQGYKIYGKLDNFPPGGHVRYFMQKALKPPAP